MPINKSLKKVLIIGSGPIVIGQAAEFDYSGTQACSALKEEGITTILINNNPATIMTDKKIADKVYIEPLNIKVVEEIIKKEKPDGILAGFGGQTALNIAMQLDENGILNKYGVKLLGTSSESIKNAEDREAFKNLMIKIDEPIPGSAIANNIKECLDFVKENGLPVIIRPAFTLGGTGGGIAETHEDLLTICARGLECSPITQILLEQSIAGWKEIEYEVIRDKNDNCIIICNMENLDPVGIHTGDSIVVAPSQTLSDKEYQMLRDSSIKIIRALEIEGGCNVQYGLDPFSNNYIVIEVNPRVSRSSALASKAVGYPIAKIAAKIAIGYTLNELKNYVTKVSSACFEPALDYVVVKFPKWPFDKFTGAKKTLGTQMQATGEVMAIDRTFERALLKSLSSLEGDFSEIYMSKLEILDNEQLILKIKKCDDERVFAIAEAFRRDISVEEVYNITKIDRWFLNKIAKIVAMENKLKNEDSSKKLVNNAKKMGFSEKTIKNLSSDKEIAAKYLSQADKSVFKMVDTCSGEFDAQTPYYYSCYEGEDENIISDKKKIIVIGSGPIRIGQGIEFDYSCVHGVWSIKEAGYEAIMINNNPETVSTDFDIADKLYFESLNIDYVMDIIEKEKPEGVILQLGGQTSINLAQKLSENGVNILGSSYESIDTAEDRDKFRAFLDKLNIPCPVGDSVFNEVEAKKLVSILGYPVVIRPSYVIGGRSMEVITTDESLSRYMDEYSLNFEKNPVLIDKYIRGIEIEVDAISDGQDILIPGILEHIEKTGVHSGDSISVYPPITLSDKIVETLIDYTKRISKEINAIGLINIQYVFDGSEIYIIEVNPRASRTIPILSKVTDVPMVKIATEIMLGAKLKNMGYGVGLLKAKELYAVKVPVFSGEKLTDVDMYLGPEMKSTGEVLGIDKIYENAVYKGFKGSNIKLPLGGHIYVSLREIDKSLETVDVIKNYVEMGFEIYASFSTGNYLEKNNIACEIIPQFKIEELIKADMISIMINTPTRGNNSLSFGFKIRRMMLEKRLPLFTCVETAGLFKVALEIEASDTEIKYMTMKEYLA
ncbi:MAG: carbamoyl-phosphate synthase (glutamine-hydrolyzing) large subunit [Acidaminobacteraceae bacterium]